MPFDPAPQAFFGPGYELSANKISLPTSSIADISVGTFTAVAASAVLTTSVDHNLKVGDKVSLSTTGADLPEPFDDYDDPTPQVYYVVSVPAADELTLSLTKGGTAITATDAGTGTHTLSTLGTLQEVTDTEANASSGDYRKVGFGIVEMMYQKHVNTPTADRSTKFVVTRTSSTNETTGIVTRYYQFAVQLDPVVEVTAE